MEQKVLGFGRPEAGRWLRRGRVCAAAGTVALGITVALMAGCGGSDSDQGDTGGGTSATTAGSTAGATAGSTAGTTAGANTAGATAGSTAGSTAGAATAGATAGSTAGTTAGSTAGAATSGATAGAATAGSTAGTTAGAGTAGATGTGSAAGEAVFAQNCGRCHHIGSVGSGKMALDHVGSQHDADWLKVQIRTPQAHHSRMPAFPPSKLSDADLQTVVTYLLAQK